MSNVGMKMRKFVNVVTQTCRGDLSSLRRIKASDLFYESTEEAEQEAKKSKAADPRTKKMTWSTLPNPQIEFNTSCPVDGRMDFLPFYGAINDSNKILCVDVAGQTVLYDADAGSVETLPCLHKPKGHDGPLALSVARPGGAHDPARPDALYVLDKIRGSFEALVYGDPTPPSPYKYRLARCPDLFVWHWLRLATPPYASGHEVVQSYALLDGDTICVSSSPSDHPGTYFFNTATEQWTKAGSWILPFYGRAYVVPELDNLCFGIQDIRPHHLCALDFSSSMDGGGEAPPPRLRHHWPDMVKPRGWRLENVSMAYMGAGRFCIAKTFDVDATVLNGVEVVLENGGRPSKSKLRMIRHKSVSYDTFSQPRIECVL
jgi:hypothetical protein